MRGVHPLWFGGQLSQVKQGEGLCLLRGGGDLIFWGVIGGHTDVPYSIPSLQYLQTSLQPSSKICDYFVPGTSHER